MFGVAPHPTPAAWQGPRPYVLLVDDHVPSLCLLSQIVDGAGHPCVVASSATKAIACFDVRPPKLVVTDLAMPNLDGRGLASWLKFRHPSVPLILLTGQDLDAETRVAFGRTFTAILSKPVNVDRLLTWLDRLMPPCGFGDPTLTARPACPYDAKVQFSRGVAQPG